MWDIIAPRVEQMRHPGDQTLNSRGFASTHTCLTDAYHAMAQSVATNHVNPLKY